MAEAGSFAERVKQQADIVRVVGEYVRLKKSGQNFTGLCPFHSEKTASFAVHPVKQIYHCFGCGVGGDVFKFVMEMEKCAFPDALRVVAEKCGIAMPSPRERSPEEKIENQQRSALVEMHREAAGFFVRQLEGTLEGKAARAYLEDRGLDPEVSGRFGIGYAPSGGEVLYRHLKGKYPDKLIDASGLVSRDQSGRLFDRFRRRIMFPIANESGKIVAFGGRALGDDLPKYLNSPETPIYSKSNVLYHLDRAKEAIRRECSVIVVEGYMDAIAVARAGISNVVAACGTSFGQSHAKILRRFFPREGLPKVVLNFDPDLAGVAAAGRFVPLIQEAYGEDASSQVANPENIRLARLFQFGFELYVLKLPERDDPDQFIRRQGASAYRELVKKATPFIDYIIGKARAMDLTTSEGKVKGINFILPYVQNLPNPIIRSDWATRIAQQLRVDEPVLREALRKAATERRSEVKTQPELTARTGRPAERRLVKILAEAEGFREQVAREIRESNLHQGLETERIFTALVEACLSGEPLSLTAMTQGLEERDRRLVFEIVFEEGAEPTWEEAESCLAVLRRRQAKVELDAVQREIETKTAAAGATAGGQPAAAGQLRSLLERKQELRRRIEDLDG